MPRRARRPWLYGLIGLFLLLAGALAALFTLDLGLFQGQIQRIASQALGREVTADHSLSIRLGGELHIQVLGLRVANPEWAAHPNLLEVDRLRLSLRLSSLWRGPLDVTAFEAGGLRLWVERDAEGRSTLGSGRDEAPGDKPDGAPFELPVLRQVSLQDLEVQLSDPQRTNPLQLRVASLAQQLRADGLLELQLNGSVNGNTVRYQGTLGDLEALVQGRGVRYQGAGELGPLRFSGKGVVDDLAAPRHPDIELELSGPDIGPLASLLGRPAPAQGAFHIHARSAPEQGRQATSLQVDIADFSLQATGASTSFAAFRSANFDVMARGPDLGAFSRFLGLGSWPGQAFRFEGHLDHQQGLFAIRDSHLEVGETKFVIDAGLPRFPAWRGGTGSLDITGPDVAAFRELLGFKGRAEGDFEVHLRLAPDDAGGDRLQGGFRTSLAHAEFAGVVGEGPHLAGTRFTAELSGPDAGILLGGYGLPGFEGKAFQLSLEAAVAEDRLEIHPGSRLRLGDDHLEGTGTVGFHPFAGATALKLAATGRDLSRFAPLLRGGTALPGQPFSLAGGLALADRSILLDKVRGTIGRNDIGVDGTLALASGMRGSRLRVSARGPRLDTLIADTPRLDVPSQPFELDGSVRFRSQALEIEQLKARIGTMAIRAAVSLDLPLGGSNGHFDVHLAGPDPGVLWPGALAFQPAAQAFEIILRGRARKGLWTFDDARLEFGAAEATLKGALDHFPDFSATRLQLAARVPDQSALGSWRGKPLEGKPLSVSAVFSGSARRFLLDNLVLHDGPSDLRGRLSVDFESDIPVLEWHSRSTLLDLSSPDEEPTATTTATNAAGPAMAGTGGLPFPDLQLPLAALARFNGSFDFAVATLRLPRRTFTDVVLDAELRDGGLRLTRLRGNGLRGYVDGSASLLPRGDGTADFALDVAAKGLVLNISRDRDRAKSAALPIIEYAIDVTGRGASLHQLAASLDGNAYATASPGVIPNSQLQFLDQGLLRQVFQVVLPESARQSDTRLECAAVRVEARDGLVTTTPAMALVTDKVQMFSSGTIDLDGGALDLNFQNFPNKAYKANVSEVLVNPFVKIAGTLAAPKITLDAPKALIYSGIAVGTGGLSILAKGLLDRMRHSANPCEKVMEEAHKGAGR